MKSRNVQIPEELFVEMVRYFLLEQQDEATAKRITALIEGKVEAMNRHELYTKYKTSPTAAEQEKARRDYLDSVGMRDGFRW